MKTILSFVFMLVAGVAQAHPSLVPHQHPHGASVLPDLGTFVVGGIFLIAAAMVAYTQLTRR